MNETKIDIINGEQKPGFFKRVITSVWPFTSSVKEQSTGYHDIEVGQNELPVKPLDMEIVNPLDLV